MGREVKRVLNILSDQESNRVCSHVIEISTEFRERENFGEIHLTRVSVVVGEPELTHAEGDVLVEGVEDQFRQSLVCPSSVDQQQGY